MASSSSVKGNKVELSTFENWGKKNLIGYKTEETSTVVEKSTLILYGVKFVQNTSHASR